MKNLLHALALAAICMFGFSACQNEATSGSEQGTIAESQALFVANPQNVPEQDTEHPI